MKGRPTGKLRHTAKVVAVLRCASSQSVSSSSSSRLLSFLVNFSRRLQLVWLVAYSRVRHITLLLAVCSFVPTFLLTCFSLLLLLLLLCAASLSWYLILDMSGFVGHTAAFPTSLLVPTAASPFFPNTPNLKIELTIEKMIFLLSVKWCYEVSGV